jgi:uncharacterized protein YceK
MKMILLCGLLALAGCQSIETATNAAASTPTVDCDTNTAACNPVYPDGAPK